MFFISMANAQSKNVSGFSHVESVASDGKFIYAADIGKELNPTAKDGDGKILKLDLNGKILDSTFVKEKLNAPKGIATKNGVLYAADIDRIVAIDLKTGKKLYEISFGNDASFLNDIAIVNKTTLYVTVTDKSKIYKVDLNTRSYTELITDKIIAGANGLFYDSKSNRLYVNGFGSENKPNGTFGYINLVDNKFTRLTDLEGYYDGIWLLNGTLYISNWVAFEKKGIIQILDLTTSQIGEVKVAAPFSGPADFIILKNQLIVPEMMSGSIQFIKLK
jgi:sugar lactone lactonase YvrE